MKAKKNTVWIVGGILLVFLVAVLLVVNKKSTSTEGSNKEVIPTEAVIPTVSGDVEVDLLPINGAKEVKLAIDNIPDGTNTVEYELSYQTKSQGLQGVISAPISLKKDQSYYEKTITLGTCSSGACVYHQVLGKIKLTLKFSGNYGERIYENEYAI